MREPLRCGCRRDEPVWPERGVQGGPAPRHLQLPPRILRKPNHGKNETVPNGEQLFLSISFYLLLCYLLLTFTLMLIAYVFV